MASSHPRGGGGDGSDRIPITIHSTAGASFSDPRLQPPLVFSACDVTIPSANLLSLQHDIDNDLMQSPSLNALTVKPKNEKHHETVKRHSIGTLCGLVKKASQESHLYKVRDDLDLLASKVKQSGKKLSRSWTCLKSKLLAARKDKKTNGGSGCRIKVEHVKSSDLLWPPTSSSRKSSAHSLGAGGDSEDLLEMPNHNYSTSLVITDLCDGCFAAQIPVGDLPPGDLTIRIRHYKMEIVVGRRPSTVADDHRVTHPVRYGDIDIPIYVNPDTLCFDRDEAAKLLYVYGHTKGYNGTSRPKIASAENMRAHNLPFPSLSTKYHSDIYLPEPADKSDDELMPPPPPDFYRQRHSLTVAGEQPAYSYVMMAH